MRFVLAVAEDSNRDVHAAINSSLTGKAGWLPDSRRDAGATDTEIVLAGSMEALCVSWGASFADELIRLRPLEPRGPSHIPARGVRPLFLPCTRAAWEHLPRAPNAPGRLRCALRERCRRSVPIRNATGRNSRSCRLLRRRPRSGR